MKKPSSISISLRGIPPSLNRYAGRENSWEYRQAKKEWTDTVAWLVKGRMKQPFDRAVVRITYFFPDRRRHDPDNYAGKFLLDGLVQGGVLVDDSFQHITLDLQGGVDPEDPRTEILVEER